MLVFSYILVAIGIFFSAALVGLAMKVLSADKTEAKRNAARAPKASDVLMGRAKTREDWLPDARVKGGMVYNRRIGRIEICGRLSDDSLDRVYRRP